MNIKNTIAAINQMQLDGVIERYAIGGAVGATFYLEPVATLDVDVFITFRPEAGRLIASPQPILTKPGCSSLSKPARSIPRGFNPSFRGTACRRRGNAFERQFLSDAP